jgi:hypothetical protein
VNKNAMPIEILKVSLPEIIEAAKFCVNHRKKNGGCLGYPAAILLFSIIDSIGSYFKENNNIKIIIDGKSNITIKKASEHFRILNSKYFNQNLSARNIEKIYSDFRCCLTHNSVLAIGSSMTISNNSGNVFEIRKKPHDEDEIIISITDLFNLCEDAVNKFLKEADIIVPNSEQNKKILGKKN